MGWTDSTTVKKHLLGFTVDGLTARGVEVILGDDDEQLPHQNLETGSVRVAAMLEDAPAGPIQLTLTGTTWYSVGDSDLLIGSVTITPDNIPTDRYIEGVDFSVNHEDGEVKRLIGGNITSGQTVYVWYLPLTVYTYDDDYTIKHAEGELARSVGGSIPNPARLIVDYTTSAAGATDSLISEAITEAEDKILAKLRDEYDESSGDQGLKTGATELTLSVICDDLAIESLSSGTDPGADDRAKRFMELAKRYEQRAAATLARFLTQPLMNELQIKSNPASAAGW